MILASTEIRKLPFHFRVSYPFSNAREEQRCGKKDANLGVYPARSKHVELRLKPEMTSWKG